MYVYISETEYSGLFVLATNPSIYYKLLMFFFSSVIKVSFEGHTLICYQSTYCFDVIPLNFSSFYIAHKSFNFPLIGKFTSDQSIRYHQTCAISPGYHSTHHKLSCQVATSSGKTQKHTSVQRDSVTYKLIKHPWCLT